MKIFKFTGMFSPGYVGSEMIIAAESKVEAVEKFNQWYYNDPNSSEFEDQTPQCIQRLQQPENWVEVTGPIVYFTDGNY